MWLNCPPKWIILKSVWGLRGSQPIAKPLVVPGSSVSWVLSKLLVDLWSLIVLSIAGIKIPWFIPAGIKIPVWLLIGLQVMPWFIRSIHSMVFFAGTVPLKLRSLLRTQSCIAMTRFVFFDNAMDFLADRYRGRSQGQGPPGKAVVFRRDPHVSRVWTRRGRSCLVPFFVDMSWWFFMLKSHQ